MLIPTTDEDSAASGIGGDSTDDSLADSGAVFVFRRVAGVWQNEAYLKSSDPNAGDFLGWRVSLSGDVLAAAAPLHDSGVLGAPGDRSALNSGAVFVFQRVAGVWTQRGFLQDEAPQIEGRVGWSVSAAGDVIAVGAPFTDWPPQGSGDPGTVDSGAAIVFRQVNGVWLRESRLRAPYAGDDDRFGNAVAVQGDTLLVGAYLEDGALGGGGADDDAVNSGAVYVFQETQGDWVATDYLKAVNSQPYDYFGFSVALTGTRAAIGAIYEDGGQPGLDGDPADNSVGNSGAVYGYRVASGAFTPMLYGKPSNLGLAMNFGWSVALSYDALAVGALHDSGTAGPADDARESGGAYVFH